MWVACCVYKKNKKQKQKQREFESAISFAKFSLKLYEKITTIIIDDFLFSKKTQKKNQ